MNKRNIILDCTTINKLKKWRKNNGRKEGQQKKNSLSKKILLEQELTSFNENSSVNKALAQGKLQSKFST